MKLLKNLLFLLFCSFIFSQNIKYQLLDAEDNAPISDAIIQNSSKEKITTTDQQGYFMVDKTIKVIVISRLGYFDKIISLNPTVKVLSLNFDVQLSEVILKSRDKLGEKLVKEVIEKRKENSPNNLDSYQFIEYNKMLFDINPLNEEDWEKLKAKKDTSEMEFYKIIDKSALFLSERVKKIMHSSTYGNHTDILASKTSGLQQPIYEFLSINPISYYLNDEQFNFFLLKYVNPISETGLKVFKYSIQDTLVENEVSVITLRFSPKDFEKNKRPLIGYVKIEEKTKAILSFYAERAKKPFAYIQIQYKKRNGYYFPESQEYKIEFPEGGSLILGGDGEMEIEESKSALADSIQKNEPNTSAFMSYVSSFKEFKIPASFKRKDFAGYQNTVNDSIVKYSDNILNTYRDQPLAREQRAYFTLDSVLVAEKATKYIKYNHILTRRTFPIGNKWEWDFLKLIQINDFEGLRTEANLRTNENFSTRWGVQGYFGYGFKDRRGKFGAGISYLAYKRFAGTLFAQYKQDVDPFGRYQKSFFYEKPSIKEAANGFYYKNYFYTQQYILGYEQDLFSKLTTSISGEYENIQSGVLYSYNQNSPYKKYPLLNLHLNMMWRPFSKYIATPYGKVTIEDKPTYVKLHFMKSFGISSGEFNFETIEMALNHKFPDFMGHLNIFGRAGYSWNSVPLFYNFEGQGNAKTGDNIGKRFSIVGYNMFETLEPGRFYMDKYYSFDIRQEFPKIKIGKKKIETSLVYRGLQGNQKALSNTLLSTEAPTHYYQEMGLEIKKLIWNFGISTFYRLGYYSEHNFSQDIFLKLNLKIDLL